VLIFNKIDFKKTPTVLFCLGFLIFIYTATRAAILSITWDEAFTYLEYVRFKINIEDNFSVMSANNHWLNTTLCIAFVKWFGVSEFVLRMPSLLALIIYLFISAKLCLQLSNKWWTILSFVFLNTNPYVLDFFCLSRGYALSIALMLWSVYLLYLYLIKGYKIKHAAFSMITAALAVLANFVLLNYFVVLAALLTLLVLINVYISEKEKSQRWKQWIIQVSIIDHIFIALMLFIIPKLFLLRKAGALFYGTEDGFWKGTVTTAIKSCFYGINYGNTMVFLIKGFIVLVILVALIYTLYSFIKKDFSAKTVFIFLIVSFIIGTAISTMVQHKYLHTLYLFDRTTLFYMILFSVLLIFVVDALVKSGRLGLILKSSIVTIQLIHFLMAINFSYVWEWKSNADSKQMAMDLENLQKQNNKPYLHIGSSISFDMPMNYYRVVRNWHWLMPVERDFQTLPLRDYILLDADSINSSKYNSIQTYPITGSAIVQSKRKITQEKIIAKKALNYQMANEGVYRLIPDNPFGPSFQIVMEDSLFPQNNSLIQVNYKIKVPYEDLKKTAIVIAIDRDERNYLWRYVYLKDLIKEKHEWNNVYFSIILPKEAKPGDKIISYISNASKQPMFIEKAEINWLTYTLK